MTLYHFGNCLALIYGPYHMLYKFSGISEYSSFSKCVYAGCLYIFTQLCKMLLLATFFPDSDVYGDEEGNIFMEILKATVDYADLVGLYFALNAVPGKSHAKILTAAIGWAGAEVAVTQAVGLWAGARGAEFSWRPVRRAAGAPLAALAALAPAAALAARAQPAPLSALATLAIYPYKAVLVRQVGGAWAQLGARTLLDGTLALFALRLHALHNV